MTALTETMESPTSWFVGASFGRTDDQTPRFLSEGIWELKNPTDQETALVKSMSAGDRIAIKAAYTRKHSLPFDNRGHTVSVMAIKATGMVTDNLGDGERVRVSWTTTHPIGEWYFFTYRATIWRVRPGDWMTDGLIAFAFEGKPQETERFRNEPYWRERFGSATTSKRRFGWTNFYEAIAEKLLAYKDDRQALVKGIQNISLRVEGLGHLAQDQYAGGGTGFVKGICPFTTMGLFNLDFTATAQGVSNYSGITESETRQYATLDSTERVAADLVRGTAAGQAPIVTVPFSIASSNSALRQLFDQGQDNRQPVDPSRTHIIA